MRIIFLYHVIRVYTLSEASYNEEAIIISKRLLVHSLHMKMAPSNLKCVLSPLILLILFLIFMIQGTLNKSTMESGGKNNSTSAPQVVTS